MEMRRMVRRRLLAAEAAAAVLISMLVLSTHLASNSGSLSASMAPEVFWAKNSSYGSELHARDSCQAPNLCGDPGTAHAESEKTWNLNKALVDQLLTNDDYIGKEGSACSFLMKKGIKEDRLNPYNNQTEYSKALSKGSKNGGGSATVDEITYFRSDEHTKTCEMVVDIPYRTPGLGFVFRDKTSPLVDDVSVDAILDIAEGYEGSQIEDLAIDTFKSSADTVFYVAFYVAVGDMTITVDRARNPCGLPSYLLVPAHNDSKPPIQWMFLNPLTKELWLATVFFFTGFVFWMLERSINPEFQGSSLTQFSTALYFVLSTLTFSHGQILRSPLSKIVLVVWCFAVLVLVQSYVANLSSMLAAEASTNNGSSSAAGSAPLTLRSFSGLFVVTGCISALMLLISVTRSAYAAYTRVRGSESQSTPQNDAANGSVVPEQPVQEVRDNNSQGAHVISAISRDEEAGGVIQDSISNAAEPAPDVYVQIEMT